MDKLEPGSIAIRFTASFAIDADEHKEPLQSPFRSDLLAQQADGAILP